MNQPVEHKMLKKLRKVEEDDDSKSRELTVIKIVFIPTSLPLNGNLSCCRGRTGEKRGQSAVF